MSAELTFDDYNFLWKAIGRMSKAKDKYLKQPRPDREEIRALTADANQLIREYNERAVQQIFATLQARGEGLCRCCKKVHPAEQMGRYEGALLSGGVTLFYSYLCDECDPKRGGFIMSMNVRSYNPRTHQTKVYLKPKRVPMSYVGAGQHSLQEFQQMMREEKRLIRKVSSQLKLPIFVEIGELLDESYYELLRG